MKNIVALLSVLFVLTAQANAGALWMGQWIGTSASPDTPDTWIDFKKNFIVDSLPRHAVARIAADSKYWLYVNGSLVVFEGALKRGPEPSGTYYDEVDIARWLVKGDNDIRLLLWYFGRDGFSHKSSGKAGLLFDCRTDGRLHIVSDTTWLCRINPAYGACGDPKPNYRLPESSILFDARKAPAGDAGFRNAVLLASPEAAPWGRLVRRPVPLWKFSRPEKYMRIYRSADSLIGLLPYNAQITPVIRLRSVAGKRITIGTDNYFHYNGATENIRAEYITAGGEQEYESPGWMNGHRVYYVIPDSVEVLDISYRESGYDCAFAGSFKSSDAMLDSIWTKARRTLYVTMRDTYMDCPERERAQWTGDAVIESGMSYYALSPESHALARKWLLELAAWQRPDSVVFAPVPAGNWNTELPGQSLASVGYFGAWNYYMHTGDLDAVRLVYPAFRKYLMRWRVSPSGMVEMPRECWLWADWGDNRDVTLIINAWYYLALKGMRLMAEELGIPADAECFSAGMDKIKHAFNSGCWNGNAYRSPRYAGADDDRVQALAVVAGIAGPDKYPALLRLFGTEFHASPYMEKYVFEAMMMIGAVDEALERHRKRFRHMVLDRRFTTLFEHWNVGVEGFGGGSVNHAWTGGGLTVLSQYLCGISPLEPGYRKVRIMPRPGSIRYASAGAATVRGPVRSSFQAHDGAMEYRIETPPDVEALVGIPATGTSTSIKVDGQDHAAAPDSTGRLWLTLPGGTHTVIAAPGI